MFETALTTESYHTICQDQVAVYPQADRTIIVVADGAGGTSCGEQAAKTVIDEVRLAIPSTDSPEGWCGVLRQIDSRIGQGESTAVVIDLRIDRICGASVGDSQAWAVKGTDITILTANQQRKPLLGTGDASPVGFAQDRLDGLLIVATDGFCNYVQREKMVRMLPYEEFAVLPKRLVDLVRLRSGALNDDVGIVVCRHKRQSQNRRRVYTLSVEDPL